MKGLEAVLEHRGVPEAERTRALETFERLGYLDDDRFAASRAARLAERGYGDEAIRFELTREGLDAERVEVAVERLAPELERARALATGPEPPRRTAARLGRRGFSFETIETLFPDDSTLGAVENEVEASE